MDQPGVPARADRRDPARQPLLRRLLRRQLRQPRPLRRRHHLRADPVHRAALPRSGRRLGAVLYGGSTGGWEALAAQVFYPDEYNGCFAACPDPIDFRAYTSVDLYQDENAYYYESAFKRRPRPGWRDWLGQVHTTIEDFNHLELVLGSRGRSGDQFDIWQAVYSPMGEDGYPQPIWDKRSGQIDRQVAAYWREHYDLRHILERDWQTLGPKLEGKIHIYCGDMDNYYLNNAVYLMARVISSGIVV